jgi:hypothetical protein
MKLIKFLLLCLVAALSIAAIGVYYGGKSIHKLLWENQELKQAITNLTEESRIGYVKVIRQEVKDGELWTTLKFVETARDDEIKKILEKEYTIQGDIIHFDALIIKFGSKMVMDGKERALYIWRRVYGEIMAPEDGFEIEEFGTEPLRYKDIFSSLPYKTKMDFWENIWQLSNEPEKLKSFDIEAIYGNVTYSQLKTGRVYIFKITPTGQVYPEVIPDF